MNPVERINVTPLRKISDQKNMNTVQDVCGGGKKQIAHSRQLAIAQKGLNSVFIKINRILL